MSGGWLIFNLKFNFLNNLKHDLKLSAIVGNNCTIFNNMQCRLKVQYCFGSLHILNVNASNCRRSTGKAQRHRSRLLGFDPQVLGQWPWQAASGGRNRKCTEINLRQSCDFITTGSQKVDEASITSILTFRWLLILFCYWWLWGCVASPFRW